MYTQIKDWSSNVLSFVTTMEVLIVSPRNKLSKLLDLSFLKNKRGFFYEKPRDCIYIQNQQYDICLFFLSFLV